MQGAFKIEKLRKLLSASSEPITIRSVFEYAGVHHTVEVNGDSAYLHSPKKEGGFRTTSIWYGHHGAPIPNETIADLKRQFQIELKEVNNFYTEVLKEHVPEAIFDAIVNGQATDFARKIQTYQNNILEGHRATLKAAFSAVPFRMEFRDTKDYEEGDLKGTLRLEARSKYIYLHWRGSKRLFCKMLREIESQAQYWCELAQVLTEISRKQSS
jgi:hypothetical protein